MVVPTAELTLTPSTCQTVNADADAGPINAPSASADKAPTLKRVILFIVLSPW